jgi:hypothetical protein
MDFDLGGWLWFVLDVTATAILALCVLVAYRSYQERFASPAAAPRSRQVDEERHRSMQEEAEPQRFSRS